MSSKIPQKLCVTGEATTEQCRPLNDRDTQRPAARGPATSESSAWLFHTLGADAGPSPIASASQAVVHTVWNPCQVSADGFVSTMHSEDTPGTKNNATRLRWRKETISLRSNPLCELGSRISGSRDHYCHSVCDTAKQFYNFYKRVQNLPCLYQRQSGCNLPSTPRWDSSTLTCFALTDFHWRVPIYKLITIYSPADRV